VRRSGEAEEEDERERRALAPPHMRLVTHVTGHIVDVPIGCPGVRPRGQVGQAPKVKPENACACSHGWLHWRR
jgi:hypothetical protein